MGICWMAQETHTGALYQPRYGNQGDEREVQTGGDICIPMTGSVKQLSFNKKKIDQGLKHKTCIKILEKYRAHTKKIKSIHSEIKFTVLV